MDGFKRPTQVPERQPMPERILPRPGINEATPSPVAQPATQPTPQPTIPAPSQAASVIAPVASAPAQAQNPTQPPRKKRRWPWVLLGMLIVLIIVGVATTQWYFGQLSPVNTQDAKVQRIEIKDGSTFNEVATMLEQRGVIRNAAAFDVYARLHGKRDALKASTCSLAPSMSTGEILDKITAGCHDFISVMFYPGATIEKPLYKPADSTIDQSKMYIKYILKNAGFSDEQITAALAKQYQSPLFADKPAGKTLEGYIFGETYYVDKSATAEQVLEESFAQMYSVVKRNDLVAKYKTKGLTLYQGITLASIVQRELNCEDKPSPERKDRCYGYQQTIAQIFLKRLKENISLGSDVTFIYAADMKKVTPSVDIDSPYNTRKYPGLPPGPIASPGELALKAVGNPSDTDYLYFIAGDDGLIYFAKDEAGHQKNITNHCKEMCGNAV